MNQSDHIFQQQHQNLQQQQPVVGVVPGSGEMTYANPYQAAHMVATGTPAVAISSPSAYPASQLAYHHQPQQFNSQQQQQSQQQLQAFWASQMQEVEHTTDFKNQSLPLARIKKIMKADEDVRMISAEAPVVFAKACEMFILELTQRSWIHTEENKRRTLQKNDIAAAISRTDVFDFLVDIIPRDELREEGLGVTKATIPSLGSPSDPIPYYYVPQHSVGPAGMTMGKPADQATLFTGQHPQPPLPYMPWPPSQGQLSQPQERQSDTTKG